MILEQWVQTLEAQLFGWGRHSDQADPLAQIREQAEESSAELHARNQEFAGHRGERLVRRGACRGPQGLDFNNLLPVSGDNDSFAFQCPINQPGKLAFSFGLAVGGHSESMIGCRLLCPMKKLGGPRR